MSIAYTFTRSTQAGNAYSSSSGQVTVTNGAVIAGNNTVVAATNETFAFVLDYTKVQSIWLKSDIATNFTFKKAGPANELNVQLVANQPYLWTNDGYFTCPLGNNIISVNSNNTNATNNAVVEYNVQYDPT